jgi:flagellar assembly protein FliH
MSTAILKSPVLLTQRRDLNVNALVGRAQQTDELRASVEATVRAELQAEFEARLEAIRDEARSDGYQEGLSSGHEEGKAAAMDAFRKKQVLLENLLERAEEGVDEWMSSVGSQALNIAKQALCELLGEQVLNTSMLQQLIQKMTSHLRPADVLQVRLHPTDCAVLRTAMRQSGESHGSNAVVAKLTEDVSLDAGGVVVETPRGEYIATLDVLLRKLVTLVEDHRSATASAVPVFHALRA